MKKTSKKKRILAIIGIILLLGLYGTTLLLALMKNPASYVMFQICFYATILAPVLIYAMMMVYRVLKRKNREINSKSINAVIFDVGNVLVDFDYKTYLESFGFPKEEREILQEVIFESDAWAEQDRGVLSDEEVEAGFIKACPTYAEDIKRVYRGRGRTIAPMPYTRQWLISLKKIGLRVYILSNYGAGMYEKTKETLDDFLPLTNGAVFSYREHSIKPEKDIYERLLTRYKIDPDRAVFIDDRSDNVAAGESFGLHGIVFKNYEQAKEALKTVIAKRLPEA